MAYGLFLYKEFVSKSNKTIRLEIFQKDYAGISAEIESMGNNPLVLVSDNANSSVYLPIVKSYLDISIVDTNQVDYSVFFTPDATKFKVIVKVNGTPEWSGYLTPDSFEQDLRFRGDISLTARDNLGMLSEFDYDLTNSFYSITTLIDTALTKIGFQFTLEYRINKVDSLNETIRNGLTQSKFWVGKTWQEVLETILTGMGCQMRYVGGNKFAIYDIGYLSYLGTPHTPQTFSFIEQGGNQEIIPAWKVLTINQDYGLGDNIYDGFVEQSNYDFYAYRGGDVDNPYNFYLRPFYTIPLSSDWVSTIPMLSPYEYPNIDPNNLYITGKSPENTLFMSSKLIYGKYFEAISDGKAIQFKFKANNYPHYITQRRSGEYMVGAMLRARYLYTMKVRCNLFAQTATEKYVLQGQRWIPWTISYDDALEFNLPQTKESSVYGKQGTELTSQMDSPQDQDITIEAYGLGESANVWIEFYPYTATYTEVDGLGAVDDYPAIVFDVHTMKLSEFELRIVENETGGLESKVTINANHNINGAVDLSLGEVPSGLGGYHTYLAGIFKNSHPYYPPMTGFHFAGGTNYKLSELIGREIAHHYKTQKNKLSGTIINSTNFAAMPSFGKTFTDGVKNYALNYGALDFRNETMQVELIEVEDYVTEDYTFVEAEVESGSGSMGSGENEYIQWSAAGNAKRIYELDTASEADQAGAFVFIDKSGLSAAKKVPISSLLVDAYTKTESDSRFASIDGDLTQDFSAKKLTTATLLLPQTAPILASGEAAIYSLDSGFSGELPSGAGSVTSIALTMPTGFSVSGSPITESGTFGVTFVEDYFLPTTTQFASKLDVSLKGSPNGLAELDENGFVKNTQLPSYVDDVLEYGYFSELPVTGEGGKIYVITNPLDTEHYNKTYRWSGTIYTEISASLALGETSSTAYRGDRGKIAYDHTFLTNNPHSVTFAQLLSKPTTLSGYGISSTDTLFDGKYIFALNAINSNTIKSFPNRVGITLYGHGAGSTGFPSQYGAIVDFSTVGSNDPSAWWRDFALWHFAGQERWFLRGYRSADGSPLTWREIFHSANLLNIGTTASSARTALELGSAALKSDTYFALLAGSISQPFSASKLTSTTLLLPQSAPSLASGEMAIYGLESGFSGELPSGAGSVTSIALTLPTGLRVKKDAGGTFAQTATITESGEFIVEITSGYALPTTLKQTEWDSAFSAKHNAVTLGTANGLSLSTQVLSLGLASTSANGALSSTDWNTFNGKQAKLIGTGTSSLVRVNTLGTITYDDNTYLTGNQTITLSGIITGSGTTAITTAIADNALSIAKTNGLQTALDAKMATASYPDLVAIEALTGTSGLLKKTAANTWSLDTNTYLTTASATSTYLPLAGGTLIGSLIITKTANTDEDKALRFGESTGYQGGFINYNGVNNVFYIGVHELNDTNKINDINSIAITRSTGAVNFEKPITYLGGAIYHSSNSNSTSFNWDAKNLTLAGSITGATNITANGTISGSTLAITSTLGVSHLSFARTTYNYITSAGDFIFIAQRKAVAAANPDLYIGDGKIGLGYYNRTERLAVDGTTYFNGNSQVVGSLTMTENINTNLRIPKVAPTSPTSGQYYFYIVE